MLFQINSMWQLLGWVLVFAGLVILNEICRRDNAIRRSPSDNKKMEKDFRD